MHHLACTVYVSKLRLPPFAIRHAVKTSAMVGLWQGAETTRGGRFWRDLALALDISLFHKPRLYALTGSPQAPQQEMYLPDLHDAAGARAVLED